MKIGTLTNVTNRLKFPARPGLADATGWASARGEVRFSGQFDVIGDFPGFQSWAALIVNATVRVSEHFLLVDEYAAHGFGIAFDSLVEYSIDRDEQTFGDIVLRFQTNGTTQLFRIRPTRGRMRLPIRSRPTDLAAALAANGLPTSDLAQSLQRTVELTWESAHSFAGDEAVWSGAVTAPLRPGLECGPGQAWLTKTSLLWGSAKGKGLNRIPTATIVGVGRRQLEDGRSTPIAYVQTRLMRDLNLTLPFIFNQETGPKARIDRDTFMHSFHPDLQTEIVDEVWQPWADEDLLGSFVQTPKVENDDDVRGSGSDVALSAIDGADTLTILPLEEAEAEEVETEPEAPNFSTWEGTRRPVTPGGISDTLTRRIDTYDDLAILSSDPDAMRLAEAISIWPGMSPAPPVEPEAPTVTEPVLVTSYLVQSERAIDEVNEAIDRRLAGNSAIGLRTMPPSSADQAEALLELIELAGIGYYSSEQLTRTKAKLSGFGEAAVRLRSLMELCNAGHLTISEAAAKRDRIMSGIAILRENGETADPAEPFSE